MKDPSSCREVISTDCTKLSGARSTRNMSLMQKVGMLEAIRAFKGSFGCTEHCARQGLELPAVVSCSLHQLFYGRYSANNKQDGGYPCIVRDTAGTFEDYGGMKRVVNVRSVWKQGLNNVAIRCGTTGSEKASDSFAIKD